MVASNSKESAVNNKLAMLILLFFILIPLISDTNALPINVWPKPTNISWTNPSSSPLSPNFAIVSPDPSHPHLQPCISHYTTLLQTHHYKPIIPPQPMNMFNKPITHLVLSISDLSQTLQHNVDESYTLNITSNSNGVAKLTSFTVWGAMRGLETFLQLTWGNPSAVATDIFIGDEPVFAHRGILLDTSRNYYPKVDILRTIDAMAMNKLNVFHWHVTDSHSFPIVLPSEPELAKKGAYGEDMMYSVKDVMEIVEHGLSRGVRVMPEIDTPGHTGSWAEAYPEIMTCANKFWLPNGPNDWAARLAAEPGTGQLNPLNPKTYKVMHNIIQDMASLFPENFYHAGADEITPACWLDDLTIQNFTSKGGTLSQLLELFVNSTHPHIVSYDKTVVYWEDALLDPIIHVNPSILPPETTVLQTWKNGPENTKQVVQAGYRVIVSSSDYYYLDCGHGGFVGNDSRYDFMEDSGTDGGSWCAPFKTWQRIYDYDITQGLDDGEKKLVIGGEVALWSEQADSTVLDSRLWPRASAMAEALWSGNRDGSGRKRYADATDRLNVWRYRMVGRGVMAEPIQPLWCVRHPGMCNVNS